MMRLKTTKLGDAKWIFGKMDNVGERREGGWGE